MQTFDLLLLFTKMIGVETKRCPADGCGRWFTRKYVDDRRVGIYMRDCWYCSSSCFRRAAEQRFSQLLSSGITSASHMPRMPLGLLLISRGVVSSDQLQLAAVEQKKTGKDLGEVLVSLGSLSAKQLASARAAQWDCPVFAVPKGSVTNPIRIPRTILEGHSMVPLHYAAATNSLLVGFVQSVEYGPLYTIERITGCKTQACFVTQEEFRSQMERRAIASGDDPALTELVFRGIESPLELSRIVANYGSKFRAEEATIDICREHLWARLTNGAKAVDLLFKIS
jgi:hypothetical protein